MQTKHNKYVVNQMRGHFDDISVALSRTIVGSLGTINVILPSYPVNKCIILDFNGRSELKKQIIRIGRTVFHEKKNVLRRYKYIVLERDKH
jgi:hypothetical protein